jgi:hypothetical protein
LNADLLSKPDLDSVALLTEPTSRRGESLGDPLLDDDIPA